MSFASTYLPPVAIDAPMNLLPRHHSQMSRILAHAQGLAHRSGLRRGPIPIASALFVSYASQSFLLKNSKLEKISMKSNISIDHLKIIKSSKHSTAIQQSILVVLTYVVYIIF